jgi:hypothetical protein
MLNQYTKIRYKQLTNLLNTYVIKQIHNDKSEK